MKHRRMPDETELNGEPPDFAQIDKFNLDQEWIDQPRLYFTYAERLAEAREKYERMVSQRDLVEAQLDRDIRKNPMDYGLEKITEPAVEKAVLLDKGRMKAHEAVVRAKYTVEVLAAKVTALDHRKKALENLVSLFLANYFSEPKPPKGAGERVLANQAKRAFRSKRK